MPSDQDLRYAVRVQDAQLKELQRNIRALNKDLSASERAGTAAGSSTAAGMSKADRSARSAAVGTQVFGRSMKDAVKIGLGASAAFATFQGVAGFLRSTVPAALEAERSLVRLDTQLEAIDLATAENIATIEKSVRAHVLLAGVVDDELVRDSLVNLIRSTKDITRATELNALALDIAIAKNISLETASRLVARVYAGNTGALGRYGIVIDKGASSTQALTILQERFAGQAAAAGETAEGAFGRFSFRVEELKEEMGRGLIPVLEAVATRVGAIADAGVAAAEALDKLGDSLPGGEGLWEKLLAGPDDLAKRFDENLERMGSSSAVFFDKLASDKPWEAFVAPEGTLAQPIDEASDAMTVFDRIAAGVGETIDQLAASLTRVQERIEKRLRSSLLEALEDVHEKALDEFDRQTEGMVSGHDKVTDSLMRTFDKATDEQLRRFDKTTDRLVENIRVTVKAGEGQFEIGRGQLTPAERELEALEKLDARRRRDRQLAEAREELGQAQLIGDPTSIRDAKRALQDAELEQRKARLEGRAKTERELADKALAAEEERLREQRDAVRRDIDERRDMERDAIAERRRMQRDELADRRAAMRENLDEELAAQQKALEKGKRAAANAQRQILKTLRSFGADYAGVGTELGGKFLEGFLKAILEPPKPLPPIVPERRRVVPIPRSGGARGGLAGQLGKPGASDTVIAGLTPGEMILTAADQRMLANRLGAPGIGWPLLSKIRMGFAEGGVIDEDLLRMLLQRFASGKGGLADDTRLRGKALTDPRMLKGELSTAEMRALSPVHIQSMLMGRGKAGHLGGLSEQERTRLGRAGVLELMGTLAQAQAHPVRSGLVSVRPSGLVSGPGIRDPGGASGEWFGGPQTWNISGDEPGRTADKVRRELNKLAARNGQRRRGRNAGSIAGLRRR